MNNINYIKNKYAYVLKSIKKDTTLKPIVNDLKGKTYLISGASRGIGYNIAKKLALSGANVSIIGKTQQMHPRLSGTIYNAAERINDVARRVCCHPISCDIRIPNQIDFAINDTIDMFGKIDGVVLNASVLVLKNTLKQTDNEVDLLSSVNINGTYLMGKKCLKYIKNSTHPSVLVIAPPIEMLNNDDWWINHLYYSMSKFNMSIMAKFWNKEFPNVSVNTLWPRTTIATAPVQNLLGGSDIMNISRKTDIMGDAAEIILKANPKTCTGKNFIDDEVIASMDIDIEKYRYNNYKKEKDLMPDFFVN